MWTQRLPVLWTLMLGVFAGYNDHCQNQKAQTGLDMDELMGMWYGIEVFYHRERVHTLEPRHEDAICPVIQLSRDSKQSISMVWQEPSRFLEYYFIIRKPGVWLSQPIGHSPFDGFVRVLKAVSSHMVLTFCSNSNHYSVLMSREKYLDFADIEGVGAMIERFNLTIYDKSRQCRSSASTFSHSVCTILVLVLVCLYRWS